MDTRVNQPPSNGHGHDPSRNGHPDFDPGIEIHNGATFFDRSFPLHWLVESMLVCGQPCVIGGPRKSLKTAIVIDLALSLTSGQPFLGRFPVHYPCGVWAFFGESNEPTVQQTAGIVAAAKGINPRSPWLHFSFRLPRLSDERYLRWLTGTIRSMGIGVVIIDPLYLALLAGGGAIDPKSLYSMGPLLLDIAQAVIEGGATPILVHHTVKTKKSGTTNLEDLAYSGIAEFARSWVLLSRRSPFVAGTGFHDLTMSVGGSVGFGDSYLVNVHEGQRQSGAFRGSEWRVEFVTADAPSTPVSKIDRMRAALAESPEGETLSGLAKLAKLPNGEAHEPIDELVKLGEAIPVKVWRRAGGAPPRETDGYAPTPELGGTDGSGPVAPGQS